tara:strand:+ start:1728 stop:2789 length:1062 start_codon:yes stop_codon:yes gene_type:complete
MRIKISDFKLAEFIIKRLSEERECPFLDLNVSFDEQNNGRTSDSLNIGRCKNIGQSIYKIVQEYVNKVTTENGHSVFEDENQKQNFLISTATFLRQLIYNDNSLKEFNDEFTALRLYQEPSVWLLIKDLICPVYHKEVVNYQVIAGSSPFLDVAVFCDAKDFDGVSPEKPFIFMNMDVDNRVIRCLFLLLAVIDGLKLSAHKIIPEILESELSEKFVGILKLMFEEEDVHNFLMTLNGVLGLPTQLSDLQAKEALTNSAQLKTAQYFNNPAMWWYFGILEKMLEPARGSDWNTFQSLEPFIEDFWNKVENYRESKVHKEDGVPFNVLLDIKSEDHKTDATRIMQDLLGSERIW